MGCCGNLDKNHYEMPYEQIEAYNQLKSEIDEIITNNENPYRKDSNKLIELLNRTSVNISEFEELLDNLKNKKNIDKDIPDDFIKGLNSDIKQLKDYYLILDNLIKENDNENKSNQNEIQKEKEIKEEASLSNRDKKDNDNLKNININPQKNENENEQNEPNLNNNENIYFKKYVRRNKRSDFFNKRNNQNRAFPQADLFGFPQSENYNFITNDNGLLNKDEISTSEVTNNINNIINIIFVLQNGKKVGIQIKKNDKFLTAIEKLGEKEEDLKNIENMILLDGEKDITDKVKNGENISSFGFNDYHFIQVKLAE